MYFCMYVFRNPKRSAYSSVYSSLFFLVTLVTQVTYCNWFLSVDDRYASCGVLRPSCVNYFIFLTSP